MLLPPPLSAGDTHTGCKAMNTVISKGSLTDEQASHLEFLIEAQCILSRGLSAVTVCAEVDLHRLRRETCLAETSLDVPLQERLLALPVNSRFSCLRDSQQLS